MAQPQKKNALAVWLKKPRRVALSQKIFFVQQLGVMLKAGISLAVALKTLSEQTDAKGFKIILKDLQHGVEKGNTLAKGLDEYQKIFGVLFINMIRAGEASGKLEEVLSELFIQMKKDHEVVSKVKSAMIYPAIILVLMSVIAVLMTVYVIPALTSVFKEMNAVLPLPTRILITISSFMLSYGIYVVFVLMAIILILQRLLSLPPGKRLFHRFLLKLPIFGLIIKKINLARFCRTLSSLLKTDIPIIQSFDITAEVLGNIAYKEALINAKEKIRKGINIKESLSSFSNIFPPVVLQMIAVGEETGALDKILEESAVFYEEEVNQTMSNLPSIIEPILIIAIGIAVGALAVAVIMPIYSLSQQI